MLILSKEDFETKTAFFLNKQKQARLPFLTALFSGWSVEKLSVFNSAVSEIQLEKDDVLYEIGDRPDSIYWLMRGSMKIEANVDFSGSNTYPTGLRQW